jgi:hypothetical protein
MGKRVKVIELIIDDLDGKEQPEGTGETIRYSWLGNDWEIDLSDEHAEQFRTMMQPIMNASRRLRAHAPLVKRQRRIRHRRRYRLRHRPKARASLSLSRSKMATD